MAAPSEKGAETASVREAVRLTNQELATSGTPWRLEVRGERLGLRGPLPPRSETGQGTPTIQRLSLGLVASEGRLAPFAGRNGNAAPPAAPRFPPRLPPLRWPPLPLLP